MFLVVLSRLYGDFLFFNFIYFLTETCNVPADIKFGLIRIIFFRCLNCCVALQRWTALSGELPQDDTDVDDWLLRFVVIRGSSICFFLRATGKYEYHVSTQVPINY